MLAFGRFYVVMATVAVSVMIQTDHTNNAEPPPVRALVIPPDGRRPESPQAKARILRKERDQTDFYGDPLPPSAVARLGTERFRHGSAYNKTLAWVPGVQVIASGAGESLRFWDAATGKLLWEIVSPDPIFREFAFSPDGSQIISAGQLKDHFGSFTRIWDAGTGQEIRTVKWVFQGRPPSWIRWAVDWNIMVNYDGRHVSVWDLTNGLELRTSALTNETVDTVALSPDRKTVALAEEQNSRIYLWEWETDQAPRKLSYPGARCSKHLAFSPDSKTLASYDQRSGVVRLWDVANGRVVHKLTPQTETPEYFPLSFSPDGKSLVGTSWDSAKAKGAICFWDAASGKPTRQLDDGGAGIGSPKFSSDGRYLATVSWGGIRVWDIETGKEIGDAEAPHRGRISFVAAAGEVVATCSEDGTARLWHGKSGRPSHLLGRKAEPIALALSSDARWVAMLTMDNFLHVWDVGTGKQRYQLAGHGELNYGGALAFASDGKQLLSWGKDHCLRRWDLTTGKAVAETSLEPIAPPFPKDRLRAAFLGPERAAFSPDAKVLVWCIAKNVYVIDVATCKVARTIAPAAGAVVGLAVSPKNRFLAASAWSASGQTVLPNGKVLNSPHRNHPVFLWDLSTGKLVKQINLPDGGAGPVGFSPDGKILAAGVDRPQGPIRLWNLETDAELRPLTGLRDGVASLAFTPDSRRLISGTRATFALVWDLSRLDASKP
jgi:WD40 repeat protein